MSVVLRDLLQARAEQHPHKPFATFVDGPSWSYAETRAQGRRIAGGLHALGVRAGEPVLCWLPNGPDALRAWFGINELGAVHAPCNLAWRGRSLEHALQLSGARIAIVHRDLLPRLAEVPLHGLGQVIVAGGPADLTLAVPTLSIDALDEAEPPPVEIQPWDDMQLAFTSGTTGASKAVRSSYVHALHFLESPHADTFGPEANFLLVLPLFHAGGLATVYAVLRDGGSLVVPPGFRTAEFWPWVRRFGVTSTTLVEQMAAFLLAQPPDPADRDHPLKIVNIAPMGPAAYRFIERFGPTLWTSYGSTEVGAVLRCAAEPQRRGVTGRLREGYEARLVDEHDMEVPPGTPGEMVLRSRRPWVFASGYPGHPEAAAAAWRNGWFHTGDVFTADADGWYRFLDRRKDVIRRRGENISCYEVEQELLRHPRIRAAAAYAVPGRDSEDEVMACVCMHGDEAPDWAELVAFLRGNAPHYVVPRYFRRLDALPLTETGKVRKVLLREEALTADSWDREAAGIHLKAERIGQR
ncbi:AMP-binding protein [Pelomonas sp. KK5]|uniref:AMP-binding protein n=1 Tax=Pelomonas sp. KK5 TaxID=1855730 RepID=UPI001301DADF|nr:AMP-binding protein [Pelomonas sp. KK5]